MRNGEIEKTKENVLKITAEMCESIYDILYPGAPSDEDEWPEGVEFKLAESIMGVYQGERMAHWWQTFSEMFSGSNQEHTGEIGKVAIKTLLTRIHKLDEDLGEKIQHALFI